MDRNSSEFHDEHFHSAVREITVCTLLFLALYGVSFALIQTFKKRTDTDDLYAGDAEDALVFRISGWMCTFSLSVSLGAVCLLPFSIISNEILLLYPNSYYIQWLNSSLIQSLWNSMFLLSNLSLFIFLPFSYFFIESQGFSGSRKGIRTRVYESIAVCCLLILVLVCLAHLISIMLDDHEPRKKSLFKIWNYQLPFVYSCVSLFGVVTLLTCTPIGFARMFTVVGELVLKPKLKKDIELELIANQLETESLKRKIDRTNNGFGDGHCYHQILCNGDKGGSDKGMGDRLVELDNVRVGLVRQRQSLKWMHRLKYPVVMILLLALTGISIVMVVNNSLQLLIGFRSLPAYKQDIEIGNSSLSALGAVGAIVEVIIIIYLMVSSMVGLYSVPGLCQMRPVKGHTSMTRIIINCTAILILSCAFPLLARTLGISTFDLLGDFGKCDWLRNFYLVWSYNVLFAAASALCLVNKFTLALRRELYKRFSELNQRVRGRNLSCDSNCSTAHICQEIHSKFD